MALHSKCITAERVIAKAIFQGVCLLDQDIYPYNQFFFLKKRNIPATMNNISAQVAG